MAEVSEETSMELYKTVPREILYNEALEELLLQTWALAMAVVVVVVEDTMVAAAEVETLPIMQEIQIIRTMLLEVGDQVVVLRSMLQVIVLSRLVPGVLYQKILMQTIKLELVRQVCIQSLEEMVSSSSLNVVQK